MFEPIKEEKKTKSIAKRTLPQVNVPSISGGTGTQPVSGEFDIWGPSGNLEGLWQQVDFESTPVTGVTADPVLDLTGADPRYAPRDEWQLADDEMVLIVFEDTVMKAYPLRGFSQSSEVFNDQIKIKSIAVAGDPALKHYVAFERKVNGIDLTMRGSGATWLGSSILNDVETGTAWSPVLRSAMTGQLKGSLIKCLPNALCTWKACRAAFPKCELVDLVGFQLAMAIKLDPATEPSDLASQPTLTAEQIYTTEAEAFRVIVQIGKTVLSCPLSELRSERLVQLRDRKANCIVVFDEKTGGLYAYLARQNDEQLTFEIDPDGNVSDSLTGAQWDMTFGKALGGKYQNKRLQRLPVAIVSAEISYALPLPHNDDQADQADKAQDPPEKNDTTSAAGAKEEGANRQ